MIKIIIWPLQQLQFQQKKNKPCQAYEWLLDDAWGKTWIPLKLLTLILNHWTSQKIINQCGVTHQPTQYLSSLHGHEVHPSCCIFYCASSRDNSDAQSIWSHWKCFILNLELSYAFSFSAQSSAVTQLEKHLPAVSWWCKIYCLTVSLIEDLQKAAQEYCMKHILRIRDVCLIKSANQELSVSISPRKERNAEISINSKSFVLTKEGYYVLLIS